MGAGGNSDYRSLKNNHFVQAPQGCPSRAISPSGRCGAHYEESLGAAPQVTFWTKGLLPRGVRPIMQGKSFFVVTVGKLGV